MKSEKEKLLDLYIARVDRLPTWGLSYALLWALGFSFFITIYDAVNLGVALPYIPFVTTASEAALISSLGLFAYIPGAIGLGYLSDRIGRRPVLIGSVLLILIGSVGMAISTNIIEFYIFRTIEGAGIGADIALIMTYLAELSPSSKRGTYINLVYIGGWVGFGLGTLLASELVTHIPSIGWRLVFGIAGILALTALALRIYAPESVRFLVKKGKFDEAERVVRHMEESAMRRARLTSLPEPKILEYSLQDTNPFKIFRNKEYLKRLIILLLWFITFYMASYTFLLEWPEALSLFLGYKGSLLDLVITIIGYTSIAVTIGAIISRFFIDKIDRRILLASSSFSILLGVLISTYGAIIRNFLDVTIGLIIIYLIYEAWSIQSGYIIASELFPNTARATGFALTDGLGHLGGAIGPLIIISLIPIYGSITSWALISFEVFTISILILFLTPKTLGRRLEEINEVSSTK